jgi:hypothetical protein
MIDTRVLACAAAAFMVACPAPAFADDAYVCDGGRLVYARPETLEKLKQSDPCIAGYFKFQSAPVAASPSAAPGPLEPASPTQGIVRELSKPKSQRGKSADAPSSDQPRRVAAPDAAPGTDYRNVRVINAPGDSSPVYQHVR